MGMHVLLTTLIDAWGTVQEFTGTAVMTVSMQLLEKRGAGLSQDGRILWNTLKALYSAFIIAVLILGLGGPTGRCSGRSGNCKCKTITQLRVTASSCLIHLHNGSPILQRMHITYTSCPGAAELAVG